MKKYKNCDLSFAGIKGQVARTVEELILQGKTINGQTASDLAASFQNAVFTQVKQRTDRAIKWCQQNVPDLNTLVIVGGVARNQKLRSIFTELAVESKFQNTFPEPQFCVDNGVMIAWAGVENYLLGKNILTDIQQIEQITEIAKLPLASNNEDPFATKYKGMVAFLKRRGLSQKYVKSDSTQTTSTM